MKKIFHYSFFVNVFASCSTAIDSVSEKQFPSISLIKSEFSLLAMGNSLSQGILSPIISKLEDNYSRIISDLEINSMDKVTVRIWGNETQFLDDMEQAIGRRYSANT